MKARIHIDVVCQEKGEFTELETVIDLPFVPTIGMSLEFEPLPMNNPLYQKCNDALAQGDFEPSIVDVLRVHYRLGDQLLIVEAQLECRTSKQFNSAVGQWVNCMGFKER
jgi:hypothetical protein